MNVLIVNNGTRHIKSLLNVFSDPAKVVEAEQFKTRSVNNGTLVVLSGSKNHSVLYEKGFYKEQIELIKNYDGPIIGICAGFELIAKTFGANITRRKRRLHRLIKISNKKVYEAHRYTVKTVPKDLKVLAASSSGVEIIKHHSRPIYGLQFHPEVRFPRNNGVDFLNEILEQIK